MYVTYQLMLQNSGSHIEADDAREAEAGQAEQEAGRRGGEVGEELRGDRCGRRRSGGDQAWESGRVDWPNK